MRRPAGSLLVVVAVAVLLGLAVAPAPSTGAHPPVPLCGGCTGGFEGAADAHGVDAIVSHSELDLQFHANGTATGEATVRVNERAADRFHENATLLSAVARDAFASPERSERSRWAGEAVVRDATSVDAVVDDRTVTVSFALPDVASGGHGGVVYTDLFRRNGTVGGIDLQVDRATVIGPDDSVLVRAPDDWGGDRIVLQSPGESRFVGYGGYVAWAPDGGVVARLEAATSIWGDEAGTELPRAAAVSWVAAVLATGLGGLLALATPRIGDGLRPSPRSIAVGYGLGTVASVAAAAASFAWLGTGWLGLTFLALAPGVVVAAGASAVLAVVDAPPGRVLSRVPTGALYALPVLGAISLAVAVAAPETAALWAASASVAIVGALGIATGRGTPATVAVLLALAVTPICLAFPALSPSTVGSPSVVAWVLLVVLAGIPLFAIGRRSARDRPTDRTRPVQR